ncbi:MAG TPA: 5'/3'-nucleotidase SurE [Candidatus Polarisedimenticolia bacterium]|nr:5'/3'-nucleotidase SurE [Candidatus Polarisedimenticolia bacterium]
MTTILVTNDDGIGVPGLTVLARALSEVGRVVVVAPDRDQSAVSHALTLTHPLRVRRHAADVYSVDGTPTDCVNLGVFNLLSKQVDLVVSGINRGYNLGDDVTYSGTVAAAFEGTLLGYPSIAVSRAPLPPVDVEATPWPHELERNYEAAAAFAAQLARKVLAEGMPPGTLLNVNVPLPPLEGVSCTRLGRRVYKEGVVERLDPTGRQYYWIGGSPPEWMEDPRSDHAAVSAGRVSVTPLHLDMTHDASLTVIEAWTLQAPAAPEEEPRVEAR